MHMHRFDVLWRHALWIDHPNKQYEGTIHEAHQRKLSNVCGNGKEAGEWGGDI